MSLWLLLRDRGHFVDQEDLQLLENLLRRRRNRLRLLSLLEPVSLLLLFDLGLGRKPSEQASLSRDILSDELLQGALRSAVVLFLSVYDIELDANSRIVILVEITFHFADIDELIGQIDDGRGVGILNQLILLAIELQAIDCSHLLIDIVCLIDCIMLNSFQINFVVAAAEV